MTSWKNNGYKSKSINKNSEVIPILNELSIQMNQPIQNNIKIPKFADRIDAILYINLEHRKDRNEHCIQQIKKIDETLHKTHRIDAVYNTDNGALGCSSSHVKAVEFFLEHTDWNTCLIFEDDFTFISDNSTDINNILNTILTVVPDFDVILLSTGLHDFKYSDTIFPFIKKVESSQTASGYLVNRKYAQILLNNFKESTTDMINNGKIHENHIDQYWKRLMPSSNWYSILPRIAYQYSNYSDIEQKITDYGC